VNGWSKQADGLAKDGEWVERGGVVHDIHEANDQTERPPEK
jgi:hypothetical protein